MTRILLNPRSAPAASFEAPSRAASELHRRLPGYAPTPLRALPRLARELGIAELLVKDESERLGLPAFKVLGASWATYRALERLAGRSLEPWEDLGELRGRVDALRPLALVTATDGNHGRAVARVARWLGLGAHVFLPAHAAAARAEAIRGEGAELTLVRGTYDQAVAAAAARARAPRSLLVQDTAWPGYEDLPAWVIEGYATLFWELDDELARRGAGWSELVLVQVGVGSLAAAALRHLRARAPRTRVVSVEPATGACALAAVEAGRIVTLPEVPPSLLAGLDCGTLASLAWPLLRDHAAAFAAVDDARVREAVRALQREGLAIGESGAGGLAGLLELLAAPADVREALGLGPRTRALVLATEGVTDPEGWRRITGG